jgi:hypothetical protein
MTVERDLMETEVQSPALPAFVEARSLHSLVLLGFSTYLLAFARRVSSASIRVYVIDLVSNPRGFVRRSNAVEPDGITLNWSAVGTPAGLETIHHFVNRVHADALLTTDDFSLTWLGKNRARFEPACRLMIPQPEILEPLLDKAHQIELARECGFDLLPTWTLASAEAIAAIPNVAFPVVVRPSLNDSARPVFKALVMNTREDLDRLCAQTQWSRAPIAQPFRLGPNYVLHGMRSESGEMLALRLFKAYRKYRVPRIHFQQQLAELKDKLLAMAALAQQAVESAVDAYLQRDKGLCKYVKQNETAINTAQRELDEMAYELLAKEQPMAIDLRFILAVIKINGDLERIGDQSMGIARRTKEILKHEEVDCRWILPPWASLPGA